MKNSVEGIVREKFRDLKNQVDLRIKSWKIGGTTKSAIGRNS